MKKRYLLILSLFVFLVQITLVQQIRVVGIVPNLILIMIVMSVLIFDDKEGIYLAVTFGMLQDILVSKALGISILIYLIIAILLYSVKDFLLNDYKLSAVLGILFSTIFYHLMFNLICILLRDTTRTIQFMIEITLLETIYNTLIMFVVYGFVFKHIKGYEIR
ncbi:MAG: rod shape-determining protein MreD [Clostridiales bacterium]|nr:rod shape-determining protein MreD [Clostridiales bacterium]